MAASAPSILYAFYFSVVRKHCVNGLFEIEHLMCIQARDVRTAEVVAIKKMSYSGKQSNEVRISKACQSKSLFIMADEVYLMFH